VQPNSDCYLYVLLFDSRGRAGVLFPHHQIGLPNQVRGGVSYEIPEASKWYWFDDQPGQETFYLVASYKPLSELDELLGKMQQVGQKHPQLARDAQAHIDRTLTRGMSPETSAAHEPKGLTIRTRGVGGVVDIGWGSTPPARPEEMDQVVSGYATIVKKVVVHHR